MPKAISLIGYWEDCDLVQASETLPALMSTGISEDAINFAAASLLNFCDDLNELVTKLTSITSMQDARQLIGNCKIRVIEIQQVIAPKYVRR